MFPNLNRIKKSVDGKFNNRRVEISITAVPTLLHHTIIFGNFIPTISHHDTIISLITRSERFKKFISATTSIKCINVDFSLFWTTMGGGMSEGVVESFEDWRLHGMTMVRSVFCLYWIHKEPFVLDMMELFQFRWLGGRTKFVIFLELLREWVPLFLQGRSFRLGIVFSYRRYFFHYHHFRVGCRTEFQVPNHLQSWVQCRTSSCLRKWTRVRQSWRQYTTTVRWEGYNTFVLLDEDYSSTSYLVLSYRSSSWWHSGEKKQYDNLTPHNQRKGSLTQK